MAILFVLINSKNLALTDKYIKKKLSRSSWLRLYLLFMGYFRRES